MGNTNLDGTLTLSGAPVIPGGGDLPLATRYFYVDSVSGSNSFDGSWDSPYATFDFAVGKCTANKGDTIVLKQGHAETIIAAGGVTVDVAGINVVGLGVGADRPEFTFGTATSASVLITAANVSVSNVVGIAGIDGLTNPFHVQAANCTLDIEWQDGSSTVEAARAILTTAAADKLNVTLKYIGFPAGNACVNAIRLVGVNDATLNVNLYGLASTAWVEFLTTACTNVNVYGYMYNSGTTNFSKSVVDTATSSTWFATFYDGAAAAQVSGGSGGALAADDVSTVASNQAVPTADSTANVLERDVIGNKTDAAATGAVSATESLMAYAKQNVTNTEKIGTIVNAGGTATVGAILGDFANTTLVSKLDVPSADATGNVDISDVAGNKTDAAQPVVGTTRSLVAYLKGLMNSTNRTIVKTDGAVLTGKDPLFTITGGPIKVVSIVGRVTTVIGGAANGNLGADVTEPAGTVALSTTVAVDSDAAGTVYTFVGPTGVLTPTTVGAVLMDYGSTTLTPTQYIIPPGNIHFEGSAAQTGVIEWTMEYVPLSPSAVVLAAA